VLSVLERFGRFTRFSGQTARWFILDSRNPRRWRLIWPQLFEVGTRSVPVIMIIGAFIGMVLAVELFEQFRQLGQESRIGGVISISVLKHIGPVLAAMMLAGRVGGAFTAELGTMTVTEQTDAMRVMGTDPICYLVVPRVLACVVMIPILTIVSDLLGILGGWLITVQAFGVNNHDYWAFSASMVARWDIFAGMVKSMFFGLTIGMVSCYKGFHCRPGAHGVGQATTDAFVTSFLAIIVLNFFLAKVTNDLHHIIYGFGGPAV